VVVAAVSLRNFRSHDRFDLDPSPGLTVLAGRNGSGKTNLLEAIHFGLVGRSCRTSSDRQVIRHGEDVARVETSLVADGVARKLAVALDRSGERLMTLDGNTLSPGAARVDRPAVIVFLPDRLSLLTGSPGGRRAHIDRLVAVLNPSREGVRTAYTRALVQRNALLARARSDGRPSSTIEAWDIELSRAGSELVQSRDEAINKVSALVPGYASELGLDGQLELIHRPAASPDGEEFRLKLRDSLEADIERGFTQYGPHRADLLFRRDGRDLKVHGSQGEKRVTLLSLLLAEREAIEQGSGLPPILLLDDVMSELDSGRRALLAERVAAGGQCVITATEFEHVPDSFPGAVKRVTIGGRAASGLRAA